MSGGIEFLIASAVLVAREEGLEFVSLSASPLATSASSGDSAASRLLDRLAAVLEPAYGFRSLAAFKHKFQPECPPLLMVVPDRMALPAIGMALLRAYLPDAAPKHLVALAGSHLAHRPGRAGRRAARLRTPG